MKGIFGRWHARCAVPREVDRSEAVLGGAVPHLRWLVAVCLSGCVTTVAVAPADLGPVAGIAAVERRELPTSDGFQLVTGTTRVTLHLEEPALALDLDLSELRYEGGPRPALVLPPYAGPQSRWRLDRMSDAELTVGAPLRTAGLVVLIVLGTFLVATVAVGVVEVLMTKTIVN